MDYWRSAHIMAARFINRWDMYARQTPDGRYICVRERLAGRQLIQHLKGEVTLATYVLDENSRARFAVIDADDDVAYQRLFKMADELASEGVPGYMESSRRGGHLWFFFEESVSGRQAKRFAEGLAHAYRLEGVEVFPKQERSDKGPGACIRLPLGVHRKSGEVYPFVSLIDRLPIAESIHDQLLNLREAATVQEAAVARYMGLAPEKERTPAYSRSDTIWEEIRRAVNAVDFINRYIQLQETATGGIGYCPFHEDANPSFGVHRAGNYWHCFAGCGGGSIIDFWMRWKNLELGAAVGELRAMLGVGKEVGTRNPRDGEGAEDWPA